MSNKLRHTLFFTILLLCLGASSCASSDTMPDVGIPIEELNKDFELVAPGPWNSFKISEPVMIDVTLTSDRTISFLTNFGVQIFMQEDGEWVELEDMMEYQPGRIYLRPSEDLFVKSGAASPLPRIEEGIKSVKLRIFVIGNVMDKKTVTDRLVGGYIDVKLTTGGK